MARDRRTLVLRILTVAVFLLAIFLLAGLVTHDPADPPRGRPEVVHNICGVVGAYVSHGLLAVLGAASYLAIALAVALGGAYVVQGRVPRRYWVIASLVTLLLFLVLSLWSFDASADRHRVHGDAAAVRNACGMAGAEAGYYLMEYIGLGIWPALLAAFVGVAAAIARRKLSDRVFRIVGVLLLVAFLSGMADVVHKRAWFQFARDRFLPVGPGGVLGQFITRTFTLHLGILGTYLVLAFIAVVGLLLSTDNLVLMFPLAAWKWLKERRGARLEALGEARRRLSRLVGGSPADTAAPAVSAAEVAKAKPAPRIRTGGRDAEETAARGDQSPAREEAAKRKPAAPAEEKESSRKDHKQKPDGRDEPAIRTPREPRQADRQPEAAGRPGRSPERGRLVDPSEGPGDQVPAYGFPPLDLLDPPEPFDISVEEQHIRENSRSLEATLRQFGVEAEVVGIDTGPVITQYEVSLGTGIKVGKVIGLSDDLAIGLKAPSVRIVAPLPGRGTIGIEVPNQNRKIVRLRESIEDGLPLSKRHNLPLFLGKDAAGNPLVRDLTAMPHLLIGGTTGSGKSVCLNSIIMSILFTRSPRDVKFILVDPKMVELTMFASIPHLMCPVVSDMSRVQSILEWLITKMEERYVLLAEAGVKNIVGYNGLSREQIIDRFKPTSPDDELRLTYHMPYIILIVDELADLMMTCLKEAEASITRLAQKSRAVGIHLVLATQRPSVDVVTGLIKSNHPCRVAFQVASGVDSRTIIDGKGAEKLLGRGDMLLMQPGASKLLRAQCTYVSEEEITRVVESVSKDASREFNRELVQIRPKPPPAPRGGRGGGPPPEDSESFAERDDLYLDAVRIVLQYQRGSVSLLQRKLNIGYGRASRLIDFMAEDGVVGDYSGSQAREVLMTLDEWEAGRGEGVGGLRDLVGDDDGKSDDDEGRPDDDAGEETADEDEELAEAEG